MCAGKETHERDTHNREELDFPYTRRKNLHFSITLAVKLHLQVWPGLMSGPGCAGILSEIYSLEALLPRCRESQLIWSDSG